MFYHLAQYFSEQLSALNALTYVTMRVILAALTALFISLAFGQRMIRLLQVKQLGQFVREDGVQAHLQKTGTPTMGGVLIILSIAVSTLLWAKWSTAYTWICLLVLLGCGYVGFLDDYRKMIKKQSKGLSAREKYLMLSAVALAAAVWLYLLGDDDKHTNLYFPVFKDWVIPLGIFFIPFAFLVLTGASNAVNLTDGLDGLAIMPTVLVSVGLGIFAYVTGHFNFAEYLNIVFIPNAGETAVVCGAIAGAGLGFLWYNAHPALVFMGDVGSLALGGVMGAVALISRHEIVFAVMGGIFVLETVSVVLQVASYRYTGKRIFRMAPIHHHFEMKGWPESRVTIRFWIITVILVLIGLSTLKVR